MDINDLSKNLIRIFLYSHQIINLSVTECVAVAKNPFYMILFKI